MCDFVYVLLLDRIERQTLADRQVAALVGAELPSVGVALERFEELLNSEPQPLTPMDAELLELNRALGVS